MDIRQTYLRMLAEDVPQNLERFDDATGRFLTGGGWAVTNQDIVYPLALLYTTESPVNPYHRDERLLPYIMRGGDAWRDFQNPDGSVEFIKVDGSTWGPTFMPWSMYHWLETYALMYDELDPGRRRRWEEGLRLAYTGIAALLERSGVHNIPTWHAQALYRAGQIFERPEWMKGGRHMIYRTVEEQTPQGYWREHLGPTTSYNLVYVHALGLYHGHSGDDGVLDSIQRATDFHIRYTYPDGRPVETIDGRVKYHDHVSATGLPAFSLSPRGRRYVRFLVEHMLAERAERGEPEISYIKTGGSIKIAAAQYGLVPHLASAYVHHQEGPEEAILQDRADYSVHDPGQALIRRGDGWFYCLSGIVTPPADNRWGMDRQAFISVWNQGPRLIVGGGNSKDQPEWSNFVHPGQDGPLYLPTAARLEPGDQGDAVILTYGERDCTIGATIVDPGHLAVRLAGPAGATGQLLLKLKPRQALATGAGASYVLDGEGLELTSEAAGGWIGQDGWRVGLPGDSKVTWPVYPFNPYAADGAAPLQEAVAVLSVSLESSPVVVNFEVEA
ncbi:MAG: hypothetical protein HPY83_17145 [Anaerolineae bacterium]|nr:hypothetical protein [Anaerolineae bacterium]